MGEQLEQRNVFEICIHLRREIREDIADGTFPLQLTTLHQPRNQRARHGLRVGAEMPLIVEANGDFRAAFADANRAHELETLARHDGGGHRRHIQLLTNWL